VSREFNSSSRGNHVILLYENNWERDVATTELINQGLGENQLCVYASVDAYDKSRLANISSKINNYEENVNKRNLLIVNLEAFYDSALKGDLTPFEEFKIKIQQEMECRNNKCIIIVADCADNLFQNQYFVQCELVESWWHGVYKEWIQHENQGQNKVTIVCPHLDSLLCKHPFDLHRHKIFDNHTLAIDVNGQLITGSSTSVKKIEQQPQITGPVVSLMESQTQILVAEPEPDLQQIYDIWLRSLGFKNILVTDSGRTCLNELLKSENKSDVIVVLDSHLKDIPIVELAKQIANQKTNNRIIITTTFPQDIVSSMGINTNNKSEILTKPFRFSELLTLIRSNTE